MVAIIGLPYKEIRITTVLEIIGKRFVGLLFRRDSLFLLWIGGLLLVVDKKKN